MEVAMECPKCRHKIHINLTPEELIYCPYCEQRMIPPQEFNVCHVCGGELPPGSIYCLICDNKLVSEKAPITDQHPTLPHQIIREDIPSTVHEESPAVQKPKPSSMSPPRGTSPPLYEDLPAGYQAVVLPSGHYRRDIPLQQVHKESPVVGQTPMELRVTPSPKVISPQFVEETPVIRLPSAQTILQVNEDAVLPVNAESPTAQKPPEVQAIPVPKIIPTHFVEEVPVINIPPAQTILQINKAPPPLVLANDASLVVQKTAEAQLMPVPEIIPTHFVEEAPPPGYTQPQTRPVLNLEEIAQTVNEEHPVVTQEPTEAPTTHQIGDITPNNEFAFCMACGHKLPSDSFYCPRCGKSIKVPEIPNAMVESLHLRDVPRYEDAVSPKNEEPPIIKNPPGPREIPSQGTTPPNISDKPAPIPIRYVQPKYRQVSSREPISEVMDDRAPAMQPFPRAKAPSRSPFKPLWSKIKDWGVKAISQPRDFFSGQWRLRKLYGKWAKESAIAPEDIPSTEALKQITREGKAPPFQPIRLVYLILGAIVIVAFFILIGVTMSRCA